jgi:hypothetical protein
MTAFATDGTETLPSTEVVISMTGAGSITLTYQDPVPSGYTAGVKAYIGTTSGGEELAGTSNSTIYTQSAPLTGVVAAPPSTNNTISHIAFNDTIIPYSGYKVSLTSTAGNAYPGFPQNWQLNGGLNGTVNVSQGAPLWNGVVVYPQPILAQPLNHGVQSIAGNLDMSSYSIVDLLKIGIGTTTPAFPLDALGLINSNSGYLIGGLAPLGDCLVANGTAYVGLPCPGSPTAINQQLVNVGLMNGNSGSGASMVGIASDGSGEADNGQTDRFFADFSNNGTNPDGSVRVYGFDTQTNSATHAQHWNCQTCTNSAATPATLVRQLAAVGATSYTAQATMLFSSNVESCIGFNNAAPGTSLIPTAVGFIGTCFKSNGWTLENNGVETLLPALFNGTPYDVTMWYIAGHLRVSAVIQFTNSGQTSDIAVTPPANVDNFEVTSATAGDQLSYARYSAGGFSVNTLNMPYASDRYNLYAVYQHPIAGGLFILIPHNYKPGIANRWVIYDHGFGGVGWNITSGGNAGVQSVASVLAAAGYVVMGFNNTFENCYGNPQCVADTAAAINYVTGVLSLAPQPYMFSDSMGGLAMLNATMRGIVKPRAMVGVDINSCLAYADSIGPSIIDAAYGVPYATTSIGYDPMLATGQSLTNLLVPTMLWSSPGDTTNLQGPNALAYAAFINGVLPGTVQLQTHVGGHEDLSGFNGTAVTAFFDNH